MTPEPIEATTPITITLQAQEWNQILGILSDAPFKVVAPLINQMTRQAQQQTHSTISAPLSNGADTRLEG